MDIAASGHTHQHRPNFGLPRQDDEAPHGLLRHQDDGRHPATHQRPHAHTELPDRKQPQRGVLHVQPACFQHCAVAVQRHDIPYLYGRKCVLRGLCLALHEETGRAGPQALCPAERQPEHRSATGERHAGDKAERLRTAETVGMGTHTGKAVQSKHQKPGVEAVSRLGSGTDKPDQEHRDYGAGGLARSARGNDAGHDALRAVHHRAAEQSGERPHHLCPRYAGCSPQHEPPG